MLYLFYIVQLSSIKSILSIVLSIFRYIRFNCLSLFKLTTCQGNLGNVGFNNQYLISIHSFPFLNLIYIYIWFYLLWLDAGAAVIIEPLSPLTPMLSHWYRHRRCSGKAIAVPLLSTLLRHHHHSAVQPLDDAALIKLLLLPSILPQPLLTPLTHKLLLCCCCHRICHNGFRHRRHNHSYYATATAIDTATTASDTITAFFSDSDQIERVSGIYYVFCFCLFLLTFVGWLVLVVLVDYDW